MKALLSQCMKYMPVACMKSLMLAHEGWEFGEPQANVYLSPAYRRGVTIIAQGGAASAAACEGVASEQRETRSPEPWVKRKIYHNPEA